MGASSEGQPMPSATLPAGVAPAPPNAALLSSGSSQPADRPGRSAQAHNSLVAENKRRLSLARDSKGEDADPVF